MNKTNQLKAILSISLGLLFSSILLSQDVEPRRWASMPLGVNAIGFGYAYTSGDVFFDPLLEATDVTYKGNTFVGSYVRPLKLWNKLGRLDILVPFSSSKWEGLLSDVPTSVQRTGFGDPRIRFSLNLTGPPPGTLKDLQEFRQKNPKFTTFGVSLAVTLPFGDYFNDKLINLGANRFVFRPQAGMVHYWGPWSFEFTSSVLFFTVNNDFFNGQEQKRDPMFAFQSHLIRQFGKRYWASASLGYNQGASSVVDQQFNDDQRANFLTALSFGFSFAQTQGIKAAYIFSDTRRNVGATTNTFLITWSLLFK